MNALGFVVMAFMIMAYVVLDGYDLGVGAVAPLIVRGDRERAAAMESIGPFWNGNEVWLIAAGGALFALFPFAYAAVFSGFYLPFIVVLWLLMFRGVALELRQHFPTELWHQFWDVAFSISSALLVVIFGVALGNLLRGVPLSSDGYFQGTFAFLLNPYALLVGAFALAALMLHGSVFATMRIDGEPAERAVRVAGWLWWVVLALYVATSAATFFARAVPEGWLTLVGLPVLAVAALLAMRVAARRGRPVQAFVASSVFLVALLGAAAATLYPYLLSAFPAGHAGISIFEATPSRLALGTALIVAIAGSAGALVYGSLVWRAMAGKVRVE